MKYIIFQFYISTILFSLENVRPSPAPISILHKYDSIPATILQVPTEPIFQFYISTILFLRKKGGK